MTAFHAFQIVVFAGIAWLVVERTRALLWRAPLEAGEFRRALLTLVRAGDRDRARELVRAATPSWIASVAWAWMDPDTADAERRLEAQSHLMVVEDRVTKRLRALRLSAPMASAIGFIGAAIEFHWIFTGSHGLLGLQAGLVESIGLSRAAIAIGLGLATSTFAVGSWIVLRKAATRLVEDARRTSSALEEALG